jgi:capsular polysaccharide biosynthesis protein
MTQYRPDDEISMHQVLQIFTKRWKYLLVLGLVGVLGALIKHKYMPSYPAKGRLIIKDVRNSQLQNLLSQVVGSIGNVVGAEEKGDNAVTRSAIVLDTHEFYFSLAKKLKMDGQKDDLSKKISFHLFNKFKKYEKDPEYDHRVAHYLRRIIGFSPANGGQLIIRVKTRNRHLSVWLVNAALQMAKGTLIERELKDLEQAESFFKKEMGVVRDRLDRIESSTISKMQNQQVLSLDAERGESSKYMNELKKEINEIRIKLTANKRRINSLIRKWKKRKRNSSAVISKFNERSQIKALKDENKDLSLRLVTLKGHLKKFEKKKKGLLPFQHDIEKRKANYILEYKVYESLRDRLSRIGLQKTYVKNRVEVLENERSSRVHSSPGLIMMVLIAVMISQVVGMGWIYLYELFKPVPNSL